VGQEDLQHRSAVRAAHVDDDRVGKIFRALVDVAAHRDQRRDRPQRVEHREAADVAGMEDRVRRELTDQRGALRVRITVRVRHDRYPQRAIVAKPERRLSLPEHGHPGSSSALHRGHPRDSTSIDPRRSRIDVGAPRPLQSATSSAARPIPPDLSAR
jgi:hypothetical protein